MRKKCSQCKRSNIKLQKVSYSVFRPRTACTMFRKKGIFCSLSGRSFSVFCEQEWHKIALEKSKKGKTGLPEPIFNLKRKESDGSNWKPISTEQAKQKNVKRSKVIHTERQLCYRNQAWSHKKIINANILLANELWTKKAITKQIKWKHLATKEELLLITPFFN